MLIASLDSLQLPTTSHLEKSSYGQLYLDLLYWTTFIQIPIGAGFISKQSPDIIKLYDLLCKEYLQ